MFLSARPASSSPSLAASCSASESVGNFVRITSAGPTVSAIDIDATPVQIPDGVIIAKPTPTTCVVQTAGVVALVGVVAGASYFVGTSAFAQVGPPPAPGSGKRAVHFVGRGVDTDRLLLRFTPPKIVIA